MVFHGTPILVCENINPPPAAALHHLYTVYKLKGLPGANPVGDPSIRACAPHERTPVTEPGAVQPSRSSSPRERSRFPSVVLPATTLNACRAGDSIEGRTTKMLFFVV